MAAISAFDADIKTRIARLSDDELGANGKLLKDGAASEWMGQLGAIQVMGCSARDDPLHFDGGNSYWHMGITLYGRRTLVLKQPGGPDLLMPMRAGHVYAGNLCCAEHLVRHDPQLGQDGGEDLLQVDGLGAVQLVVLVRSRIFRQSMATTAAKGPNPHIVWHPARDAATHATQALSWMLPSLSECQQAETTG